MFNEAARKELEEIRLKYPNARAALLPALYVAQREFGWLSPDAYETVSDLLGMPKAIARGVGTFYAMYKHKPAGQKHRATLHECLMHDPGRRKTCGLPEGQIRA